MSDSPPSRASRWRSVGPLTIAWLAVLVLVVAGAGLVVLLHPGDAPRTGVGTSVELPPAKEPAKEKVVETAPQETDEPPPAVQGPPKIAVVVTGLGLAKEVSEQAVERLPPQITLSFSPYATDLPGWIFRAQAKGHEVLVDLPMEPTTFPNEDPGPQGLLSGLDAEQNLGRLRWILNRAEGFIGVAAVMGSRFTTSEANMQPVLQELQTRGVLFLDNSSSVASVASRLATQLALPHIVNDRALDEPDPNREALDARLVQVESLALRHGFSVAMTRAYPFALQRLADWAISLEARGFALAPVSALVGLRRVSP